MSKSADLTQLARLRAFALVDTASAITGSAAMVVVHQTVAPSPSLLMAVGVVCVGALIMASSMIPLRNGNAPAAVMLLAVANWWTALGAATIATFAWPLLVTASLIPAMLAGPYLKHRQVQKFVAVSLAVSLAVAALGLLQDVTGMSADLPQWIRHGVLITFTPFLSSMVVLLALQSSSYRQTLLNELIDSRARIVVAADRERQRIERDLHDGAQQHLVALALQVSEVKQLVTCDTARAVQLLGRIRQGLHSAQSELRELAQGIYPSVLTEHGLTAALDSVAGRAPLPVRLRADEVGRHAADVEAAVYFCCLEAVQNTFRHGGPNTETSIELTLRSPESLRFVVTDDGCGITSGSETTGRGIQNMVDRIGAIGGRLSVTSIAGEGTRVQGDVPTKPTH